MAAWHRREEGMRGEGHNLARAQEAEYEKYQAKKR